MKRCKSMAMTVAFLITTTSQVGFAQTPEPEDCLCDGKLTTLTLRYLGDETTSVTVVQQKGEVIYTDGDLTPGEIFALTGTDQRGKKLSNTTLGPKINLFLGDGSVLNIHTSCSVEINVGDVIGDFRVIAGTSRHNGAICDNTEPPDCDPDVEECPDDPDGEG